MGCPFLLQGILVSQGLNLGLPHCRQILDHLSHHFSWHDKLYYGMNFNIAHASLWRRKWQPTPVFLPGESHGRRSLVGCSPWGCTESDTTERLAACFLTKRYSSSPNPNFLSQLDKVLIMICLISAHNGQEFFPFHLQCPWWGLSASLVAQMVKHLPAMQEN